MSTPREPTYIYSTSQGTNAGGPTFANVRDTEVNRERATEDNPLNLVTSTVGAILGTTYCLIILCILLILPIIEVAIGSSFRNQCPIEPRIPVYLIVTGACGIASIVLTIAVSVAFVFFVAKGNLAGTVVVAVISGIIFLILFLMSLFLFAWFIAGNVWIFGAKQNVVYDDTNSPNYCHPTLYNFAFTILILSYIMALCSCCSSCFRVCFQKNQQSTN